MFFFTLSKPLVASPVTACKRVARTFSLSQKSVSVLFALSKPLVASPVTACERGGSIFNDLQRLHQLLHISYLYYFEASRTMKNIKTFYRGETRIP